MNKLTQRQSTVYEYLKTGAYTPKQVAEGTQLSIKTVTGNIKHLLSTAFIKQNGIRSKYTYNAIEGKEYQVAYYAKGSTRLVGEMPARTKLSVPEYPMTAQQVDMLRAFKAKKLYDNGIKVTDRTPLSKLTGIPKIYVNFELERMG